MSDDEALDELRIAASRALVEHIYGIGRAENTVEAVREAVEDKLDELFGPLEALKGTTTVELDADGKTLNVALSIPRPITITATVRFES